MYGCVHMGIGVSVWVYGCFDMDAWVRGYECMAVFIYVHISVHG